MLRTLLPQSAAMAAANRAQALVGYGRVSLEAKVASATPHELVQMLYGRLISLLRDAHEAAVTGNVPRRLGATERAISIIEALDGTLDYEAGETTAKSFHLIYELLRLRLLAGDAESLAQAISTAEAISQTWAQIAPKQAGQS